MTNNRREITSNWFVTLRDMICMRFEQLEQEYSDKRGLSINKFERKSWERPGGGGGVMSIMRGNLFEKVGVNVSTVMGEFSKEFRSQIPGTDENPNFFATGISLVSHMKSPLVPAAHFNTRYIETSKFWFGGGGDLTPTFTNAEDTAIFHNIFKIACDKYDHNYYPQFSKECDEYFYVKHRMEPRGVGGIFYDYLNTGDFEKDFAFTQDIGRSFLSAFPEIIIRNMDKTWTIEEKETQLVKRGRYVEFNLLYDRGTKFGLMTNGNTEAILMSMPPEVKWP